MAVSKYVWRVMDQAKAHHTLALVQAKTRNEALELWADANGWRDYVTAVKSGVQVSFHEEPCRCTCGCERRANQVTADRWISVCHTCALHTAHHRAEDEPRKGVDWITRKGES